MMELEEQAVEGGLVTPWKRITLLALVTYAAAVASGVVADIIDGPFRFRPDFVRLPIIEAFELPWSVIFVPVLGFCILCSAIDRSTTQQINLLAGGSTFFYYLIDEIWRDLNAGVGISLYLLITSTLVYFILFRRFGS